MTVFAIRSIFLALLLVTVAIALPHTGSHTGRGSSCERGQFKIHNSEWFIKFRPTPASFCFFLFFSPPIQKFTIPVDGVLGIRTRDCRMVDADKSTVLWRPPFLNRPFLASFSYYCLFNTVDIILMFNIKVCMWLDSNCGPLLLEATALPTEPQPLLNYHIICKYQSQPTFRCIVLLKSITLF